MTRTRTRTLLDTTLVLAAGALLAACGGAGGALTVAGVSVPTIGGVSVPAQAASAPRCVSISTPGAQVAVGPLSPPAGCTVISTGRRPVGGASAPAACVDIRTPRASVTTGGPDGCTTVRVPGSVGGRSAPVGAASPPVARVSPPRCVVVTTPGAEVRTGC